MFDENEPLTPKTNEISLGCDLSTLSIEEIDERVELLEKEITRLKKNKKKKLSSFDNAQSFFKI